MVPCQHAVGAVPDFDDPVGYFRELPRDQFHSLIRIASNNARQGAVRSIPADEVTAIIFRHSSPAIFLIVRLRARVDSWPPRPVPHLCRLTVTFILLVYFTLLRWVTVA